MKAVIVLVVLLTLTAIFLQYRKKGEMQTSLVALVSFGLILSLAAMGNMTRTVIPLFLAHIVFVIIAWVGLIWYLIRGKYYWWLIFLPVVTITTFWMLELLTGSAHQNLPLAD